MREREIERERGTRKDDKCIQDIQDRDAYGTNGKYVFYNIHIYIYIYIYTHIYIPIYTCIYIYIYVYIYVSTGMNGDLEYRRATSCIER